MIGFLAKAAGLVLAAFNFLTGWTQRRVGAQQQALKDEKSIVQAAEDRGKADAEALTLGPDELRRRLLRDSRPE